MHCHICNAVLTTEEIKPDPQERGGWKPCNTCIKLSYDASDAYRYGTTIDILIDELFDQLELSELNLTGNE